MAANVGHRRLAKEEASGHLQGSDPRTAGLPRFLRLHDRYARRNQDVTLVNDCSLQVRKLR